MAMSTRETSTGHTPGQTPRETSGEAPSTTIDATRARQGRYGRHVFWVLLFGTILAAIGLFSAWGLKSGDLASTEPDNGRQAADAAAFTAPEPAPIVPQPSQSQATP